MRFRGAQATALGGQLMVLASLLSSCNPSGLSAPCRFDLLAFQPLSPSNFQDPIECRWMSEGLAAQGPGVACILKLRGGFKPPDSQQPRASTPPARTDPSAPPAPPAPSEPAAPVASARLSKTPEPLDPKDLKGLREDIVCQLGEAGVEGFEEFGQNWGKGTATQLPRESPPDLLNPPERSTPIWGKDLENFLRLLDWCEPYWRCNTSEVGPAREELGMFHPVLRSDWRGRPLKVTGGHQFWHRAESVRHYNRMLKKPYWETTTHIYTPGEGQYKWVELTGHKPDWPYSEEELKEILEKYGSKTEAAASEEQHRETFESEKFGWPRMNTEIQTDGDLVTLLKHNNVSNAETIVKELLVKKLDSELNMAGLPSRKPARSVWTEEEDQKLIQRHKEFGNEWKKIAIEFEGRSNHAVKNRWEKLIAKNPKLVQDDLTAMINRGVSEGENRIVAELAERQRQQRSLRDSFIDIPVDRLGNLTGFGNANAFGTTTAGDQGDSEIKQAGLQAGEARGSAKSQASKYVKSVVAKYKDELQLMAQNRQFNNVSREEIMRAVITSHEQKKLNVLDRERMRMDKVSEEQVVQLRQQLEEMGFPLRGHESHLRYLLSQSLSVSDPIKGAIRRFLDLANQFIEEEEEREDQFKMDVSRHNFRKYLDTVVETALRNDSRIYFKNVDGKLVCQGRKDAYNHTANRAEVRDLDPRIEMGYPTLYDKEVAWIDWRCEMRAWMGLKPNWWKLRLHYEKQVEGKNESELLSPDELELALWQKIRAREAIREEEQRILNQNNYRLLEQMTGEQLNSHEIKRTFTQGGFDEQGNLKYGDFHYPYNPSPFREFVDARFADSGEFEKALELINNMTNTSRPGPKPPLEMPWRKQPYFKRCLAEAENSKVRKTGKTFAIGKPLSLSRARTTTAPALTQIGVPKRRTDGAHIGGGTQTLVTPRFGIRGSEPQKALQKMRSVAAAVGVKRGHSDQHTSLPEVPASKKTRNDGAEKLMATGFRRLYDAGNRSMTTQNKKVTADQVLGNGLARMLSQSPNAPSAGVPKDTALAVLVSNSSGFNNEKLDDSAMDSSERERKTAREINPLQAIPAQKFSDLNDRFPEYTTGPGGSGLIFSGGNPMEHTVTVFVLHDGGGQAEDWLHIVTLLLFEWFDFKFLNAPLRPTIRNESTRHWFLHHHVADETADDEFSEIGLKPQDEKGKALVEDLPSLNRSVDYILSTVCEEIEAGGIDPKRVVLMGFGQGGALALAATTQANFTLGAAIGINAWYPTVQLPQENLSKHYTETPVLLLHGDLNQEVPSEAAFLTSQHLEEQLGYRNVSVSNHDNATNLFTDGQLEELYWFLLHMFPKQADSSIEYIPVNKWIDYTQSTRSTGSSLKMRKGIPMGPVRLGGESAAQLKPLPATGSRAKADGDVSSDWEDDSFQP